jgi:hypothetical protein
MVIEMLGGAAVGVAALVGWRTRDPAPWSASRSWDRKLCYTLLFCRRRSQQIDCDGAGHN